MQAEGLTEKERPRQVKGLGHQDDVGDAEDRFGAIARVVRAAASVVEDDVLSRHAQLERGLAHRGGLVVLDETVVAAHQQLVDFAGAIELDGRGDAIVEDRRRPPVAGQAGPEDQGHTPGRRILGRVDIGAIAPRRVQARADHGACGQQTDSQRKAHYGAEFHPTAGRFG